MTLRCRNWKNKMNEILRKFTLKVKDKTYPVYSFNYSLTDTSINGLKLSGLLRVFVPIADTLDGIKKLRWFNENKQYPETIYIKCNLGEEYDLTLNDAQILGTHWYALNRWFEVYIRYTWAEWAKEIPLEKYKSRFKDHTDELKELTYKDKDYEDDNEETT